MVILVKLVMVITKKIDFNEIDRNLAIFILVSKVETQGGQQFDVVRKATNCNLPNGRLQLVALSPYSTEIDTNNMKCT